MLFLHGCGLWLTTGVSHGAGGIIYAITQNNDLLWYRHEGRNDGTFRWASSEGKKVASGWNVKAAFSAGGGIIYALMQNNDLLWNRHDGRNDGTSRWASNEGRKVGNQWNVKYVFSGAATPAQNTGSNCAHCNDGSCQCGDGTADQLCANHQGNDPTMGCVQQQ